MCKKYDPEEFLKVMVKYREDHGLKQREIAEACGVTAVVWSTWETGKRRPSARSARKISRALELNFFGESDYEDNDEDIPLKECPYEGDCCMRWRGMCRMLKDVTFKDGKCHFRKRHATGPNLYDKKDKPLMDRILPVYCAQCRHRVELYTGNVCEYTRLSVKDADYCSMGELKPSERHDEEGA